MKQHEKRTVQQQEIVNVPSKFQKTKIAIGIHI